MKITNTVFLVFLLVSICAYAEKPVAPVRGVWITNVDSDVLKSKQNIDEAVNYCDSLGINTLFVVVWSKGMTLYPSKTMEKMFGEEIDPSLAGRDPLKEVINSAHKKRLKVYAWFEFGLSSSYMLNGGRIVKLHPEWAALDSTGRLVRKNGFEWVNGFDPTVQDFMLSLISEVVANYDVDGIQGDDRLPAMPVEAGYEPYTKNLYKQEHNGNEPPQDCHDSLWIQWRADKLNALTHRIFTTVKSLKNDCVVSMAPNLYPWSKNEYLQDWPTWLKNGDVEIICPQIYRYDEKSYSSSLKEIVTKYVSKEDMHKVYPGLLIKLAKYYPSRSYLKSMITENRKYGIEGEVFFFYEGLKKHPDFFRNLYIHNNGATP